MTKCNCTHKLLIEYLGLTKEQEKCVKHWRGCPVFWEIKIKEIKQYETIYNLQRIL